MIINLRSLIPGWWCTSKNGKIKLIFVRIPVKSNFIINLQTPSIHKFFGPVVNENITSWWNPKLEDKIVHGLGIHIPNSNFGSLFSLSLSFGFNTQHRQHQVLYRFLGEQESTQVAKVTLCEQFLDLPWVIIKHQICWVTPMSVFFISLSHHTNSPSIIMGCFNVKISYDGRHVFGIRKRNMYRFH